LKKKSANRGSKKSTYIAIVIGIVIIGIATSYFYSIEQAKIKGESFGKQLERIQTDLKELQTKYESDVRVWMEGDITKDELLEISDMHLQDFEALILRYDELEPPKPFMPSVILFKLSTEKQLESDKLLKEWIKTDDDSSRIRSDSLLQESFEYEMAALSSYNAAKVENQQ